ncbi:barstar family protein [Kitasatospora sp. NPDC059795]|uniref:barstar family protein n=1 Tax=Kitasatospora sp. NPDC059795 TaxID=3346949 RepID=UPI0036536BF9
MGREFPVRYLVVREDEDGDPEELWARCADVEGLFLDRPPLPREVLTMRGCAADSALARAVTGARADPVRLLGDVGLTIRPGDPAVWGPVQFWDLEEAAVLAHRPTPGEPGRVDIVLGAGVREDRDCYGRKPSSGPVEIEVWVESLNPLGPVAECRAIDGLFGARRELPDEPVQLLGCEAAEPLLDRLRGGPGGDTGEIWLSALDRNGRTMTGRRLDLSTVTARPSVFGGTLIDITVTGGVDPYDRPPRAARAVREVWFEGVPSTPNQWAGFDAEGRSDWLDLTRVGRYDPQAGRSGGNYHLDGRHATDRKGVLLALGEALLGPGANYGRCLDSVQDYLCGGPEVVPPFTLVWHNAEIAREALAGDVLDHRTGASYFDVTVELLREYRVTVELR